jgi:hypothetical protein
MIFHYLGFTVCRLAPDWFMVIGQNFRGYATSKNEAWQLINGVIAGIHCEE